MATKKENDSVQEEQSVDSAAFAKAATEAMQEQFKMRLMKMLKDAEELGVDLSDMHQLPPSTSGLQTSSNVTQQSTEPARRPGAAKSPGSLNSSWWEWEKRDLDDNDMVEFSPHPIPTMLWPVPDEFGRQKIKLDINNLVCWLTVGEPNRVHAMFYHAYKDGEKSYFDLQKLQKAGLEGMPWGDKPGNWLYNPNPKSFGININGGIVEPGSPLAIDAVVAYLEQQSSANTNNEE